MNYVYTKIINHFLLNEIEYKIIYTLVTIFLNDLEK